MIANSVAAVARTMAREIRCDDGVVVGMAEASVRQLRHHSNARFIFNLNDPIAVRAKIKVVQGVAPVCSGVEVLQVSKCRRPDAGTATP